jgi:protein O-GlcNAc transferase
MHRQGRLAEAEAVYRALLRTNPGHAGALHLLGLAHFQRGDAATAARLIGESVGRDGRNAFAYNNLGAALLSLQRFDEALAAFDRASALKPDHAEALNNAGNALVSLGRAREALERYEAAMRLGPPGPTLLYNRAIALQKLDRLGEALAGYDAALALQPGYADAHGNRGEALRLLKRYGEAIESFDRAIALNPDHAQSLNSRGAALYETGRLEEALPSIGKALKLAPGLPYAPGLHLHIRMLLCDWEGFEPDCRSVVAATLQGARSIAPLSMLGVPSAGARAHLECARTFARDVRQVDGRESLDSQGRAHGRIRVGYFSSDFREHPVAHVISELLGVHDRSRFEITAFSFTPAPDDPWRKRIEQGVERFIDAAAMTDGQVVELARELEIDIAVDLNGFTLGSRTAIFAARCAPVQVNFLGFPGTMGAAYIDYLIADATVVPEAHRDFYTERIVHLPHCYAPNDSTKRIANRQFGRVELGLPEQGAVFCCFNNSFKITPDAFDIWMSLLRRAPGSVLWFRGTYEAAQKNLRRYAQERGVSADRLVFAPRVDLGDHFARHRAADLFLDTFHYNAHTTASDALWAGLPVLTLMGDTFPSRVGASMLRAIGLPELVTHTKSDYEALALELATSPERLAAIRAKLESHRGSLPLFDTALYARHLETAFSAMHERQRGGLPPAPIAVSP